MKRQEQLVTEIINYLSLAVFLLLILLDKNSIYLINIGIFIGILIFINNLANKKAIFFIAVLLIIQIPLFLILFFYNQKSIDYLFLICSYSLALLIQFLLKEKIPVNLSNFLNSKYKFILSGSITGLFILINLLPTLSQPSFFLNKYHLIAINYVNETKVKIINKSNDSSILINDDDRDRNFINLDFLFSRYRIINSAYNLNKEDFQKINEYYRTGQYDKFEEFLNFLNIKYSFINKDFFNYQNFKRYEFENYYSILTKGKYEIYKAKKYFQKNNYSVKNIIFYSDIEVFNIFKKDDLVNNKTALAPYKNHDKIPKNLNKYNLVLKNISDAINNVKDNQVRIKFDDNNKIPTFLFPAETYLFTIKISNIGNYPLLESDENKISLSYHWFNVDKNTFTQWDSKRNFINCTILPGESKELTIEINTPKENGMFVLYLDIVRENKYWFSPIGVPVYRKNIYIDSSEYNLKGDLIKFTEQKYIGETVKKKEEYEISYDINIDESGEYLILIPNINKFSITGLDFKYKIDNNEWKDIPNKIIKLNFSDISFLLIDKVFLTKGKHKLNFNDSNFFIINEKKITDYIVLINGTSLLKPDGLKNDTKEFLVESYPQQFLIINKKPEKNGVFVNLLDYMYLEQAFNE